MKNLIVLIVVALAIPAAAIADNTAPAPSTQDAAQAACHAQRTAIGDAAFKQLYGTNANKSNAFGMCVSKASKSAQANAAAAANTCKTAQSDPKFADTHSGKTFNQFYGTNKNGTNAFGKCVSATSADADHAVQAATIAAAKSCKTEQAADRAAFAKKYGTNANKSNAFGKCVSAKVKTTP
jgi:delta 1-pyrroline-5-carboxylate dehydrogenase